MSQKALILDIAMNLNRIGNWAADDFEAKKKRIELFLSQTSTYIKNVEEFNFKEPFKSTFDKFLKEYQTMKNFDGEKDKLVWAEKMMTWGNILTHRAKLV